MLIELTLRRKGGTAVTIDDQTYHFRPDTAGKHVCEVTDRRHIQRFLSIAEAYQLPDIEDEIVNEVVDNAEPVEAGDENEAESVLEKPVAAMNKDELEAFAKQHGVVVDKRRSLRALQEQLGALAQ